MADWVYPCSCSHRRTSHNKPGPEGGCQEEGCGCPLFMVDGVAYAIQSDTRWIAFNATKTIELGTPYRCSNMGDAKFFSHRELAENAVEEHGPKCGVCKGEWSEEAVESCPKCDGRGTPWIVRELLPTPVGKDTVG